MNCTPLIVVRDVEASSSWYQRLLGATSGHGGAEFDMLMDGEKLLLMLHHKDVDEHPAIALAGAGPAGAGVLLYFSVDDVTPCYERARDMGEELVDEPHENPKSRSIEFSLRDPDGYAVSISQWSG